MPDVVFPTGIVEMPNSYLLYYGAADCCTAVVEFSRDEVSGRSATLIKNRRTKNQLSDVMNKHDVLNKVAERYRAWDTMSRWPRAKASSQWGLTSYGKVLT